VTTQEVLRTWQCQQ